VDRVENSDPVDVEDEPSFARSDVDASLDDMIDVAREAVEACEVVGDSRLEVSSLSLVDTED